MFQSIIFIGPGFQYSAGSSLDISETHPTRLCLALIYLDPLSPSSPMSFLPFPFSVSPYFELSDLVSDVALVSCYYMTKPTHSDRFNLLPYFSDFQLFYVFISQTLKYSNIWSWRDITFISLLHAAFSSEPGLVLNILTHRAWWL